MKKFIFSAEEIHIQQGLLEIEAESLEQALEVISRGNYKFEPREHRGPDVKLAELFLADQREV